jgi:hypothetical protein
MTGLVPAHPGSGSPPGIRYISRSSQLPQYSRERLILATALGSSILWFLEQGKTGAKQQFRSSRIKLHLAGFQTRLRLLQKRSCGRATWTTYF